MFNSKAKPRKIKSFKFDLNLVINDKMSSQQIIQSSKGSQKNNFSEICEQSILNNQGNKIILIISSVIGYLWKNYGKW